MELKSNAELIVELKSAIERKKIGQSELARLMAEHGHTLAKTTIQRFYKEGSEVNDSFNYNATLKPLAEILLDDQDDESLDALEIINLKAELKIKDETIEKLNMQINSLYAQLQQMREEETRRLDFLKNQIELKDKRMDTKDQLIQRVMDRNDKKDAAIYDLMEENKKLDEDLRVLMSRCKLCDRGNI